MAGKNVRTREALQYGAVLAVVALAVFSIYYWYQSTAVGSANYNYYQNKNAGGCGDLTDPGNVQHLSHHPSQYADCLKQVSPDVFQKATGTDKNAFMQQNGIV